MMMALEDVSRSLSLKIWPLLIGLSDGFFDAGMLLQALKKGGEPAPADKIADKRRSVGKKLALTEY